jgi:hypothetical protein
MDYNSIALTCFCKPFVASKKSWQTPTNAFYALQWTKVKLPTEVMFIKLDLSRLVDFPRPLWAYTMLRAVQRLWIDAEKHHTTSIPAVINSGGDHFVTCDFAHKSTMIMPRVSAAAAASSIPESTTNTLPPANRPLCQLSLSLQQCSPGSSLPIPGLYILLLDHFVA